MKTPAMRMTVRMTGEASRSVHSWIASGMSHMASAPPVRKPASDMALTTSPWRYPVMA
jgi:hypothetical protein